MLEGLWLTMKYALWGADHRVISNNLSLLATNYSVLGTWIVSVLLATLRARGDRTGRRRLACRHRREFWAGQMWLEPARGTSLLVACTSPRLKLLPPAGWRLRTRG